MPCPRDLYANERTLAAGIRTSLALFSFGIIILNIEDQVEIGSAFKQLGLVQLVFSQIYYVSQIRKLKNVDYIFSASYLSFQLFISISISGFLCWLFFNKLY